MKILNNLGDTFASANFRRPKNFENIGPISFSEF